VVKNIQTPAGLLPSGTVAGNQWEIYLSEVPGCLSFKRFDWKESVEVSLGAEGVRAFVLE
jgi:hypothetical protein